MTVGPVISPNLLNLPLSLAVSLGVIPRGEADGDIEELEESLPDTDTNCGPRSETTSFRMPKVRKRLWKRASDVLRAVGKPRRGINLQALENLSTATSMHV